MYIQDHLNCARDKEIIKIIKKEKLLLSINVIKINRREDQQERTLLITDEAIYNLKKKTMKRRMELKIILGLTYSSTSDEFVLHCKTEKEYDYHYRSNQRRSIIEILGRIIYELFSIKLPVALVNESELNKYVTQKNDKKLNPLFNKMDSKREVDIDLFLYGNYTSSSSNNNKNNKAFNYLGFATVTENPSNNVIFVYKVDGELFKDLRIEMFRLIHLIGHGLYGKVYIVEYVITKQLFFLRAINNFEKKPNDNCLINIQTLTEILQSNHPFLGELMCVFKTDQRTFFLSDMKQFEGGFLFYHLNKTKIFSEKLTLFYTCQIILIIEFLHQLGLYYIDISPDNFLIDGQGNIKYINFEINQIKARENHLNIFEKPSEFKAPEFEKDNNNYKNADWYCLGVLIYEMLLGIPPCIDVDEHGKFVISYPKFIYVSDVAKSIIEQLITASDEGRLGSQGGVEEIKAHEFFKGVDWDEVYKKSIVCPLYPFVEEVVQGQNKPGKSPIDDDEDEVNLRFFEFIKILKETNTM